MDNIYIAPCTGVTPLRASPLNPRITLESSGSPGAMITYQQQLTYAKVFGESIFYGPSPASRPSVNVISERLMTGTCHFYRCRLRARAHGALHSNVSLISLLPQLHASLTFNNGCRTSRRLLFSHKVLLYVADVMFLLTSAHIALLLYETLTGTVPPRVLQAAVAVAQFQARSGY